MKSTHKTGIAGMDIRLETVSGLRVCVVSKPGYLKKYAAFAAGFGSVDTTFVLPDGEKVRVPDGIAHFLEHKMFDGKEDGESVMDRFSQMGASCNAYTGYNNTTYVVSATDRFEDALLLLLDFVQNPQFTPAGVEKEKPIIEQELRMYLDMPTVRVSTNLMTALYRRHPVRVDIGGTVESIYTIDYEQLRTCHQSFYHPENMVLVVVGDVQPDFVFDTVKQNLNAHPRGRAVSRVYPDEPEAVEQERVEARMPVSSPLMLLGYKDTHVTDGPMQMLSRESAGEALLESLFARSSELHETLYREGLINDRFSARFSLENTYGYALIGGETPEPDALLGRILGAIRNAKENGIGDDTVVRLKNKLLGQFVMSLNSPEYTASLMVDMLFKRVHPYDYPRVLQALNRDSLGELFEQVFDETRMVVSVVRA